MTIQKKAYLLVLVALITGVPMAAYAQKKPYEWPPKRERARAELRQKALKEQQGHESGDEDKGADKPAMKEEAPPSSSSSEEESKESLNPYADQVWDMDDVKKYCAVQESGARGYDNCIDRNQRRVGRPKHAFDANIINSYDKKFGNQ